ncbi:DUF192 domain-containing protein [Salarchaeum japonicum]|uniref:DUF192 domain-containing protein n=1 Tax=Salarchaeum japonicum TaxID=555573 RepID=UPI003C7190F4
MRLRHNPDDDVRTLAGDVEVADGLVSRGLGLMFRRSIPEDYALAFRHDDAKPRGLHMVFVPFDIDVVWTENEEVTAVETLSAWTGRGKAVADDLYELPAGAAESVSVGDRVWLEG